MKLNDLKVVTASKPPRILIYGDVGIGKTTLASEFPSPVFIQTEDGTPAGVQLVSFPIINDYNDLLSAINSILNEPHDYKTFVIDNLSGIQKLIYSKICELENNPKIKTITDFPYGRGYALAKKYWEQFLSYLNMIRDHRNMSIILIGHEISIKFSPPGMETYDKYYVDLHNTAVTTITKEMDAVLFLNQAVYLQSSSTGYGGERKIATGNGLIKIHTQPMPYFLAKNRYDMTTDILYEKGLGYQALSKFLPTQNL